MALGQQGSPLFLDLGRELQSDDLGRALPRTLLHLSFLKREVNDKEIDHCLPSMQETQASKPTPTPTPKPTPGPHPCAFQPYNSQPFQGKQSNEH